MQARYAFISALIVLVSCQNDMSTAQPTSPDAGGDGGYPEQGLKKQGISLQGISLQGISLQGISLQGISLQGTKLQGMSLVGTTLSGMRITPPSAGTPSLLACAAPATGAARGCGLSFAGLGACMPGTQVTISTAAACGLGNCAADSVVRVCAGDHPCEHGDSNNLGESDRGCNSACAALSFPCPQAGGYSVLVGGQSSDSVAAINPAASSGAFPLMEPVSGKQLIGAQLIAVDDRGGHVPLFVADIETDQTDPQAEVLLYTLLYQDPKSQGMINPCGPDPDGLQKAIPVAGLWDMAGGHAESADLFTLACTSGVIAKCVRWGYKPWKSVMGQSLSETHQACTRMARADYCGDGTSHTHNGTLIDEYDILSIQREVSNDGMLFEGHWNTEGAYCLSKERWFNLDATDPQILLGNVLLTECPAKVGVPGPDDQFGGKTCFRKLSNLTPSSVRTSNNSYLLQVSGNL